MTVSAFRRALDRAFGDLDWCMTEETARRLEVHFGLLVRWAAKVNLTTVLDPEAAATLHYVDSLAFLTVDDRVDLVIDVGSGAGFPGLVIAASRPRPVVLLEPIRKRASFLRVAVSEMGLSDVRIVQERLEIPDRTGLFPTSGAVVSRATFPLEDWLQRAGAVLGDGGRLILSSGRGGPARGALEAEGRRQGLQLTERRQLELPGGHFRAIDRWEPASESR